jgi:hypothetical protein
MALQFTLKKALSLEWHIKYPTCKRPRPKEFEGSKGRLKSLAAVFQHEKFKDMMFDVYIDAELSEFETGLSSVENVKVYAHDFTTQLPQKQMGEEL